MGKVTARPEKNDFIEIEKPIDKVTVTRLDLALRMCKIEISKTILDKIIDLVELIEDKGDSVTIKDILILQSQWNILCDHE